MSAKALQLSSKVVEGIDVDIEHSLNCPTCNQLSRYATTGGNPKFNPKKEAIPKFELTPAKPK